MRVWSVGLLAITMPAQAVAQTPPQLDWTADRYSQALFWCGKSREGASLPQIIAAAESVGWKRAQDLDVISGEVFPSTNKIEIEQRGTKMVARYDPRSNVGACKISMWGPSDPSMGLLLTRAYIEKNLTPAPTLRKQNEDYGQRGNMWKQWLWRAPDGWYVTLRHRPAGTVAKADQVSVSIDLGVMKGDD